MELLSYPLVCKVPLVVPLLLLEGDGRRLFNDPKHHLVVFIVDGFLLELPSDLNIAQPFRCE